MDASSTLLVALMFVTILGMGIAHIIMGLAGIINHEPAQRPTLVHLGWVALMLLSSFNMFWHALDIMAIEDWTFLGFLFMVTGPTLVVFAADGILPGGPGEPESGHRQRYLAAGSRFFPLFAMLHGWVILTDIFVFDGWVPADLANLFMGCLAIYLWRTDDYDKHVYGLRIALGGNALFGALYGLDVLT